MPYRGLHRVSYTMFDWVESSGFTRGSRIILQLGHDKEDQKGKAGPCQLLLKVDF